MRWPNPCRRKRRPVAPTSRPWTVAAWTAMRLPSGLSVASGSERPGPCQRARAPRRLAHCAAAQPREARGRKLPASRMDACHADGCSGPGQAAATFIRRRRKRSGPRRPVSARPDGALDSRPAPQPHPAQQQLWHLPPSAALPDDSCGARQTAAALPGPGLWMLASLRHTHGRDQPLAMLL